MMDIHVLTETDVRRIIREEIQNAGMDATKRVSGLTSKVFVEINDRKAVKEAIESTVRVDLGTPSRSEPLVKVRITFRYPVASAISAPSDARREYLATPETARKMATHFAEGHVGGAYDVFIGAEPQPHVIGLRFEHILSIG